MLAAAGCQLYLDANLYQKRFFAVPLSRHHWWCRLLGECPTVGREFKIQRKTAVFRYILVVEA